MNRHGFSPAICVEPERPGQLHTVRSVEEAAELLLAWPPHGAEWRLALKACAEAIEGKKSTGEARDAFIIAAKAANRLGAA
ncbi:DUF982 domain-containing protein [Bosea sp. LjRoot90]|uniref:DUF982 domain-containing protein n=1 Tax=Bosea sp. LjRoot90 TaxID=3342342 RepID=UPI003ECD2640